MPKDSVAYEKLLHWVLGVDEALQHRSTTSIKATAEHAALLVLTAALKKKQYLDAYRMRV